MRAPAYPALSRSSITLAHISLTEASCLPRHGIDGVRKCVVPLMCFGGGLGTWGQALTTTAVDPSSCQPLMPTFLARRVPFLLGDSPCPRQGDFHKLLGGKVCSLATAGLPCDMEHVQMWYMPALGRSCRCCLCDLTWILSRWEVQAHMLWCQSEKCNVDLQPGTGFDSTYCLLLTSELCAIGHWHLTMLLPARAYFTPWNLELRKPGLEC